MGKIISKNLNKIVEISVPAIVKSEIMRDCVDNCIPLANPEKEAIEELVIIKTFKKGSLILREGQISTNCYSIIQGCIRQYYLIDGEERTTFFYTEGETIFAQRGNNQGKPAKHYLSCVEDTTITIMTQESENELFRRFPRFERLSRLALEEELGNYQEMLAAFMTSSPQERYLNLLENRPELLDRVPHYMLASYLGVKPESLSRIRKRIMQKAIVAR